MKLTHRVVAAGAVAATSMLAIPAYAKTQTIDIDGGVNTTIEPYYYGDAYPKAGSTVTINGVSFKLAGLAGESAGLVQTTFRVANGQQYFDNPDSITIDVSPVSRIRTLYTIAGTSWGLDQGIEAGKLIFNFSDMTSYSYSLMNGGPAGNVRGDASFAVPAAAFGTVQYAGAAHFDAQKIELPKTFWQKTLSSVTVADTNPAGTWNNANGFPLLAAVSFAAVPEPATWAMMIVGFGAVGTSLRRRRRGFAIA